MLKKGWHGKRIAVVGPNSYNWMATFFATLGGVGTIVPLDRGLPYEELESSLARSYADVLVFDETTHKEMVEKLKADGKILVKEYISMKELEGYENLNDLREQGKKALEEGFEDYKTVPIDENAVTILLFTSGTTSMSKAVMLSQQNILSNVKAMEATENFIHGDINMAFLPYHHTFGSVGQTVMLACGVATAYCDGLKYLQKNLVEYKVSVFFCVPLLIESIYKKVMQTVKKQGKEKTLATGIKISQFLLKFGIDINTTRICIVIVNMWIGVPYSMLMCSGILMNIPNDLYESARIDGASPARRFFKITLPYMLFVTGPYLITQFIGNINNFNVIYLLSGGGPGDIMLYTDGAKGTDLLITWLYKLSLGTDRNYKLASVIGILVFVISAVFSLIVYNKSSAVKGEDNFQ